MEADLRGGGEVVVIGVDGSPSMGVQVTASSPDWGGRPEISGDDDYPVAPGSGLFVEALLAELSVRGLGGVRSVGIGQDLPGYDEAEELARIGRVLEAPP
jgi:hypothetical protein